MINKTFGSVCSGIEAAHFAFSPLGLKQIWSSEISTFPSLLLKKYYPDVPNLGNMIHLPDYIRSGKVDAPDIFCGGTPCQAFSLAGWKNGLEDERGLLTMKFIEIADAIDEVRINNGKEKSIILWENVEGVLNDKTNAFGNFIGGLSGCETEIYPPGKWPKAGFFEGLTRRVAWRVLDSKYFGLPHQRKRLYVVATDKNCHPDNILFEIGNPENYSNLYNSKQKLDKAAGLFDNQLNVNQTVFVKDGVKFEFFRDYTDCLYAAYGTKWNGNAAAYNGSLYVSQDDRIRRLIPEECELLMGFPKGYTDIDGARHTNRYQGVGNSWAIPVISWIGKRFKLSTEPPAKKWKNLVKPTETNSGEYYSLGGIIQISSSSFLNTSPASNNPVPGDLYNIACKNELDKFYISSKACRGILRRKEERNLNMNPRLKELMEIQAGYALVEQK